MNLPIVFIHKGYSDYMEYSLRQAKYSNPDSEIVLLGDASNDRFDFITHVNMEDYFSLTAELTEKYHHYSTNPYDYELFCIQRWFVLKEYMKQMNIEKCFVCDSDVMIYSNISQALIPFQKAAIALIQNKDIYSLGISFLDVNSVENFCNYILRCYSSEDNLKQFEKYYLDTVAEYTVGGVSDMYLIAKWIKDNTFDNIMNFMIMNNDTIFDNHIGTSLQGKDDSYKFRWGRKIITWQDNLPYCYSYKYKKNIGFHLLHFQGPAKYLMAKFYTGKAFPRKLRLDIKFFFANIAAFWYKNFKIRYRFAWAFNIIFKLKEK